MPLLPIDAEDDWSAEIYEEAKEFFDGELRVVNPGDPGAYNPESDSFSGGSNASTVIDWRPARAQHLASPTELSNGNGWSTERRFLFQCENRPTDPIIEKGWVVQFKGGKDHTLASLAFQVSSAVNSSSAALRTIRCTTEGLKAGS